MVDVDAVRGLARQVGGLAEQTRGAAGRARRADGVQWQSVAAERYRSDLGAQAGRVDDAAAGLDAACRALQEHADAVERRLAQVRAAERAFSSLVDQAHRTLAAAADDPTDPAVSGARALVAAAARVPSALSPSWPDASGWLR